MSKPWWRKPIRMYQANNFEIDPTEIHGHAIADQAQRLNCNSVIIDAGGGISTFYPTSIAALTPNPFLEEGRDFFGEMVEGCKAKGIRIFARNDWGHMGIDVAREHPEWAQHVPEEDPPYGVVRTCPTGELFREIAVQGFLEQIERYDIDGIYVNDLGGRCTCPRCRAMFQEDTGLAYPEQWDWGQENFRAFMEWGYRKVDELARVHSEGIHARYPDKLYFIDAADFQSYPWIRFLGQDLANHADPQDIVATEAFNDLAEPYPRLLASTVTRFVRPLADTKGKPAWIFISSFPGHAWPNSNQPTEEYRSYCASVYLNGASLITPWYGHLNPDDLRLVPVANEVFSFAQANEDLLDGAQPQTPVALVWSRRTMDHYGGNEFKERAYNRFFAAAHALLKSHVPFRIIPDNQLEWEQLDGIETLIFPNVACLSDKACRTVDRFVDNGGSLLATYETSLYDEFGRKRNQFGIRSLGISPEPEDLPLGTKGGHTYMQIRQAEHALLRGFSDVQILPFREKLLNVTATVPIEAPLTWIPPSRSMPPEKGWIREYSDRPLVHVRTDKPVIYFPCELFELYARYQLPDTLRLIGNAVSMLQTPAFTVQAPQTVEVTHLRNEKRHLLGLINHTAGLLKTEPIPVGPVEILWPGHAVCSARSTNGSPCRLQRDGENTRIVVDSLATYDMLVVE